jgi:hypothetical protein
MFLPLESFDSKFTVVELTILLVRRRWLAVGCHAQQHAQIVHQGLETFCVELGLGLLIHLVPGGISCGITRQEAPLRTSQRIPLKTSRKS